MKLARVLAVAMALLVIGACSNNEEAQRKEMRDELDAEFEAQTEVLMEKIDELEIQIAELIKKHEELDGRHQLLDIKIKDREVEPEVKALQEKHAGWEAQHEKLIEDAKDFISRFRKRHEEHEIMEESHGEVPLDQIAEEHEEFEQELKGFSAELEKIAEKMSGANRQMEIIFQEHTELEAMFD